MFFYITIYNEPYPQPAEPENLDVEHLLRGIYRYRAARPEAHKHRADPGLRRGDARRAARRRHAGAALGRGRGRVVGDQLERTAPRRPGSREGDAAPPRPAGPDALRHRGAEPRPPVRWSRSSDWMRAVPEQIRPWVPNTYVTLGTDGFGFSDTRPAARRYFNTDAESVVVAVLEALARDGEIDPSVRGRGGPRVPDRRCAGGPRTDLGPRSGLSRRPSHDIRTRSGLRALKPRQRFFWRIPPKCA